MEQYQQAIANNIYIGAYVYIRLQHGNMHKARITALVPDVGILVQLEKCSMPPQACPRALSELFIKVD